MQRPILLLLKQLWQHISPHRLTTLKNCTQIVELSEGGIKRDGSYQDIVNQTAPVTQENKESNHHHIGKI